MPRRKQRTSNVFGSAPERELGWDFFADSIRSACKNSLPQREWNRCAVPSPLEETDQVPLTHDTIELLPRAHKDIVMTLSAAWPRPASTASWRNALTEVAPARAGTAIKVGAHLILVDDDYAVREVTGGNAARAGLYRAGGRPAVRRTRALGAQCQRRSDFAMPGMSGAEVARRAHTTRRALPILFVTGYADRAALEGVSDAQIIGKPFVDTELHERCAPPWPGGRRARVSCACGC